MHTVSGTCTRQLWPGNFVGTAVNIPDLIFKPCLLIFLFVSFRLWHLPDERVCGRLLIARVFFLMTSYASLIQQLRHQQMSKFGAEQSWARILFLSTLAPAGERVLCKTSMRSYVISIDSPFSSS
jgi:hypothetical protein